MPETRKARKVRTERERAEIEVHRWELKTERHKQQITVVAVELAKLRAELVQFQARLDYARRDPALLPETMARPVEAGALDDIDEVEFGHRTNRDGGAA